MGAFLQEEEYTSPTDCQEERRSQDWTSASQSGDAFFGGCANLRRDRRPATKRLLEQVPEELVVNLVVILHLGSLYHCAEGTRATIRGDALQLRVAALDVGAKQSRGPLALFEVFAGPIHVVPQVALLRASILYLRVVSTY